MTDDHNPAQARLSHQSCPLCGHNTKFGHSPKCGDAPIEDVRRGMGSYERRSETFMNRAAYWQNQVTLMHGKLAMLKGENRKLRGRLGREYDSGYDSGLDTAISLAESCGGEMSETLVCGLHNSKKKAQGPD